MTVAAGNSPKKATDDVNKKDDPETGSSFFIVFTLVGSSGRY